MNVEIYAINKNKKSAKKLNKVLPDLATELAEDRINLVYKTDIALHYTDFLENLADSVTSENNIDTIVITNALDKDKESDIYLILANLTSNMKTTEQDLLFDLENKYPKNSLALDENDKLFVNTYETNSNKAYSNVKTIPDMGNNSNAYCFFYKGKKIVALPTKEISGVSTLVMIEKASLFAISTFAISNEDLSSNGYKYVPKDLSYLTKAKRKKIVYVSFWRNIIPLKGDGFKEIFRKTILILASITFLITAGYLTNYLLIQPTLTDKAIDKIKDVSHETVEKVTDPKSGDVIETVVTRNWKALKKVNKDIVGWIKQDGTKFLDYPVLQSSNDNYEYQEYLYRDFEKNYSGYGSVFIDFRSNEGAKSKNVIMHGHNMQDGRMFQTLMKYGTYSGDLSYYKKHPTIHFDTPEGEELYKIISVYKTNTLDEHGLYFDYLTGSFNSSAEFMNYVYLVRERSLFDIPVNVNENDQLLTLSTCSYEYKDFRTVVVARKVRKNESVKVNTKKATLNSNPLWPDVHYGNNLSGKPKVTTFATEYEKDNVDWYDGKGRLKGVERMFTLYDEIDKEGNRVTPEDVNQLKVYPEKIELNNTSVQINVGETVTLKPTFSPANTTVKTHTMTTTNKNVVQISNNGVVTAIGPGTAEIIYKTGNKLTAKCKFVVKQPLTYISLDWATYNLNVKESFSLKANLVPKNTTESELKWTSSNKSVATVNSKGRITAIKPGKTTITATAKNYMSSSCVVTVYGSSTILPPEKQPETPTEKPTKKPTTPPATKPAPTEPPTKEKNTLPE